MGRTPRPVSPFFGVAFLLALVPATLSAAGAPGFRPATPTGDLPYVIVTTQKLAGPFKLLADWKTRTGLPAQVVTVEAIAADPTNAGNDLAEKVRSFLRRCHENWNTRWVLLGGHLSEVPSRETWLRRDRYASHGSPSDLYFGDVAPAELPPEEDVEIYNWNADGDGRFGENADGMDLLPELLVARLPFTAPGQVDDYLKKYFAYVSGKDGDWLARAFVVGADEFRTQQERLAELLKTLGGASGGRVDTCIEKPVADIVAGINQGFGILDIFGHGCPHHMWLGEKRSHFGVPQIQTLTNVGKCGVVFSNGCDANDFRAWESMGIAFLLNPKGGAVAYAGYTSTSFGSPVNLGFYEALFKGEAPELARAYAASKKKLIADLWMNEYLNVLGEPEMWVHTAKPKTLKVEGAPRAGAPIRLRLSGPAGEPVRGARVCLVQGGRYLAAASDAEGRADLPGLETAGKAQVSVMAQNFVPYEGALTVAAAEGPVPRGPQAVVDDDREGESRGNGNRDLSPDETVELRWKWAQPPGKGVLRLGVSDPCVELVRGEVPADAADPAFLLKVRGHARPGHQVWFDLSLELPGQEGRLRWTQNLAVQGPVLRCVRCRVDDRKGNKDGRAGWEDAGCSLAMSVTVFNAGNQAAQDVTLRLDSSDPSVRIETGEARAGAVGEQDSLEAKPFAFALDASYDGHPLEFGLEMRDRDGGTWKATIRLSVPPAPPILLSHTAGTSYVLLTWRPGGTPGVAGYNVYRATRPGGPYERLTEKPVRGATVFRDNSVKPNDDYYYVVSATTAEGLESAPSEELHARTLSPLWGRRK